jgi:acetyl-CoA C-acetyltransferase
MSCLRLDCPHRCPAPPIDRQCGSSQQALHFAPQAVLSGTMDCVIAAGVESMTRVPVFSPSALAQTAGMAAARAQTVPRARWPLQPVRGRRNDGPQVRPHEGRGRPVALQSHQRAIAATRSGAFHAEIVPVSARRADVTANGQPHVVDEGIRFDATLDGIAGVKLLHEGGMLTTASASQICDGAAAVMVVNRRRRHGQRHHRAALKARRVEPRQARAAVLVSRPGSMRRMPGRSD